MKKIDKLILQAFVGPFILTFLVIVFILLTVQMMNYVDQIFGKNLEWLDLGRLVFHFSIFQTPIAFPLSVMLASLMTFGNLGEHFELTAIKSAGISLTRALLPIFILVLFITVAAFFSNNYLVPQSALKAYSLLYDIRQKKPALDIEPGQFYGGIENFKIKVDKKSKDGITLQGITIYDHTAHRGNVDVTFADSGQMFTIMNEQYLKLILFNGVHYTEGVAKRQNIVTPRLKPGQVPPFTRTEFMKSEIVFDLSSFGMSRTDEGLFATNRLMRNFSELNHDLDSLAQTIYESDSRLYDIPGNYFLYSRLKNNIHIPLKIVETRRRLDSLSKLKLTNLESYGQDMKRGPYVNPYPVNKINLELHVTKRNPNPTVKASTLKNLKKINKRKSVVKKTDKYYEKTALPNAKDLTDLEIIALVEKKNEPKQQYARVLKTGVGSARQVKGKLAGLNHKKQSLMKDYYKFDIQWHKMLSRAFACLSMFLIGAPLGAIIKRGGLGFPVLVSVLFFLIYHIITMTGEKYAKVGLMPVVSAVWMANYFLFPVGLFFLRQARNDVRLFEADFYKVMFIKLSDWLKSILKTRTIQQAQA